MTNTIDLLYISPIKVEEEFLETWGMGTIKRG